MSPPISAVTNISIGVIIAGGSVPAGIGDAWVNVDFTTSSHKSCLTCTRVSVVADLTNSSLKARKPVALVNLHSTMNSCVIRFTLAVVSIDSIYTCSTIHTRTGAAFIDVVFTS